MSETLAIYLPRDGGLLGLRDGELQRLEPAGLPVDGQLAVVVPGEDVLLIHVALPPIRQTGRRIQAARFALEEQLASPVDRVHVALGPRDGDGNHPVAVADHEYMEAWLDTLGDARTAVVAVLPDYLCLPVPQADTAILWLTGGRALCRYGGGRGFACEAELAGALLRGDDMPRQLRVRADDDPRGKALLARLGDSEFEIEAAPVANAETLLVDLLANPEPRPPVNLLQGSYAPASAMDAWWLPLRATAALLAAWLGLIVAVHGVTYWQLAQRYAQLQASAEASFRAAFPNVQNINDIRVQAEQNLRELQTTQGNDGLFPLLAATAKAAGGVPGLQMDSLQYRDGELFLSMRGKSVQSVEQLRAGFAASGGAALDVQSADSGAKGVQIRARVHREGA